MAFDNRKNKNITGKWTVIARTENKCSRKNASDIINVARNTIIINIMVEINDLYAHFIDRCLSPYNLSTVLRNGLMDFAILSAVGRFCRMFLNEFFSSSVAAK